MSFKTIGEIYELENYSLVKFKKGNRHINERHVKELASDIRQHGQVMAIQVDKDMMIQDGQHRYEACKLLGIPVKFVYINALTASEIARVNSLSSKWKTKDYAISFAAQDIQSYKLYNLLQSKYPQFSHSIIVSFLTNTLGRNKGAEDNFEKGTFEVSSFTTAKNTAEFICSLSIFYKGYNRRSFVYAVMLMMRHPDFDKERLTRKLNFRCKELLDFSQTEDYLNTLQDIYNWKEKRKILFA